MAKELKEKSFFKEWYDFGRKLGGKRYRKPIGGDHWEFNAKKDREEAKKILKTSDQKYSSDSEQKGYALGIAHSLMKKGRSTSAILLGAKVYEKIGKGDRGFVKRRLNKALERLKEAAEKNKGDPMHSGEFYRDEYESYQKEVDEFLKRNSNEGGLEKTITTVFFIALVFGLFFLSPNLTGNVIAGSEINTTNWIGGILFVLGLVGLFMLRLRW